ncbi:MAG TPA: type II toxin-antitoxin system VapC family toxin [Dehalococcoidia bacterium]|nr:type II toxin-antitoxin system VapC family toxin [Dehalococcoidia bacterium]
MSGYACIDASVAVKWVFEEEFSDLAETLYRESRAADTTLIVPPHMATEVVNAIRRRAARSLISTGRGEELLADFLDFALTVTVPPGLYELALRIAATFNRPSAYDAHYIALAQLAGCDFWTADERLLNALNGRLPFVRALRDYQP